MYKVLLFSDYVKTSILKKKNLHLVITTSFALKCEFPLRSKGTFVFYIIIKTSISYFYVTFKSINNISFHASGSFQVIRMLLVVLLSFIICWTPQQTFLLWDVYRSRNVVCIYLPFYLSVESLILSKQNECVT